MTGHALRPAAWGLFALSLALGCIGLALLVHDWGLTFPANMFAFRGASGLVGAIFSVVGAILTTRRPSNPIGWYFGVAGLGETFQFAALEYVGAETFGPAHVPFVDPLISLQTWLWLPAVVLCTTFTFLRYPDGRLLSRGWRTVERLAVAGAAAFCAGLALDPGRVTNLGTVPNPYAVVAPWVLPMLGVGAIVTVFCLALAAISLVLRSRRGVALERAQIKWLAYAACIVGVIFAPAVLGSGLVVFPPVVTKALQDVLIVSVGGIPIAVTFAVLRYRLYDIDRLVSRTVSYLLLTGLLAAVYVGCVVLLTDVLPFGGSVGTAASVLVAVALFAPLRRRIQHVVDRRFNRARYDAEATVEAFAHRLREAVALESVRDDLVAVVGRTVQPTTMSVWLRESP